MPSVEPGSVSVELTACGNDESLFARWQRGVDLGHRLGKPPVDDQRLAVVAHDDIAGLDVAVQDAPVVGIFDGVADVGEPPQQLAQLERPPAGVRFQCRVSVKPLDHLLERVAADEPHGVIRAATGVGAQAIDRHDPRVFQAAGDLGLHHKSRSTDRVIRMMIEDLLDGHFAVELGIDRNEDGT